MSTVPPGRPIATHTWHDGDEEQTEEHDKRQSNATTGASAAGVRAVTARLAAFYFRVPVKAFFRTRVDYLAYPRAINPLYQNAALPPIAQRWSWRTTTPGILAHAIRTHGWSFLPNQVLPPLLANVTVGAALYYTYLQSLGLFYEPAAHASKRVYPPPPLSATFQAGFVAGAVQSLIAAPLDALAVRFRTADLLEGRYRSMWHYAADKVRVIGTRGVFAGWAISTLKDSFGSAVFFSSFEFVKAQCFYAFVNTTYARTRLSVTQRQDINVQTHQRSLTAVHHPTLTPHYLLEPTFLLLAGATASVLQQVILHPLTQIRDQHLQRIPGLDAQLQTSPKPTRARTFGLYAAAYRKTLKQCAVHARASGGWRRWLFADFWPSTLRQTPSTSAGLIVFEVVRRMYGMGADGVRIGKEGYDILLA